MILMPLLLTHSVPQQSLVSAQHECEFMPYHASKSLKIPHLLWLVSTQTFVPDNSL
jgi:hypothetical protein